MRRAYAKHARRDALAVHRGCAREQRPNAFHDGRRTGLCLLAHCNDAGWRHIYGWMRAGPAFLFRELNAKRRSPFPRSRRRSLVSSYVSCCPRLVSLYARRLPVAPYLPCTLPVLPAAPHLPTEQHQQLVGRDGPPHPRPNDCVLFPLPREATP